MSNWILFGFKRCGKTYFGLRLAQKMNRPFLDIDSLIEQKNGLPCREIALQFGDPYFRELESHTVRSLQCHNTIIALGGGTILFQNNLNHLKKLGTFIYLKCPKETLKQRLLTPPLPSYLNPDHPEDSFEKIYSTRIKQYETIPAHHIDLQAKSDTQILEELWHLTNSVTSFASQPGGNHTEKRLESSSMDVPLE